MAFEKWVVARDIKIVIMNFKYNFDIFNLFRYGIRPKCVNIFFIKHLSLFYRFGHINSIIIVAFQIARTPIFDERDNAITLFQEKLNPPVKCMFTFKNLRHIKLSRLKWMRLLEFQ